MSSCWTYNQHIIHRYYVYGTDTEPHWPLQYLANTMGVCIFTELRKVHSCHRCKEYALHLAKQQLFCSSGPPNFHSDSLTSWCSSSLPRRTSKTTGFAVDCAVLHNAASRNTQGQYFELLSNRASAHPSQRSHLCHQPPCAVLGHE